MSSVQSYRINVILPHMATYLFFVHDPQLWVNYNPKADSLTIYFTGKPIPSVWDDVDEYAYIGFSLDDDRMVTGLMIEHFSRWLMIPGQVQQQRQLA
jgi:hypothetical protein